MLSRLLGLGITNAFRDLTEARRKNIEFMREQLARDKAALALLTTHQRQP